MLSTVSALACYIFDTYQPILIIFFVDSKAVVLSIVYKYHQFVNKFNFIICARTVSSAATRTMVEPPSNP